MNHQTRLAFFEKIMEAKQKEMEAIMMLVPDKMKGHIEVIGKEVKMMLKDCLMEKPTNHTQSNSKVKKVDIG